MPSAARRRRCGKRSLRSGVGRPPWSALERPGAGAGELAAGPERAWRARASLPTRLGRRSVASHVENMPVFPATASKNLDGSSAAGRRSLRERSQKLSRRLFLFSEVCARNARRRQGSSTYPSQVLSSSTTRQRRAPTARFFSKGGNRRAVLKRRDPERKRGMAARHSAARAALGRLSASISASSIRIAWRPPPSWLMSTRGGVAPQSRFSC